MNVKACGFQKTAVRSPEKENGLQGFCAKQWVRFGCASFWKILTMPGVQPTPESSEQAI